MKFDLHIHSEKSYDSKSKIAKILLKAKRMGLDGIAITEHDLLHNYDIKSLENEYKLWIIPGVELNTDIGDIIALFVDKISGNKNSCEVIDEIHEQGGLAVLAHPFKRIKNYPIDVVKKLDAIESVNSRWIALQDHKQFEKVNALLSTVKGKTAGSDSHFIFEVGNAFLETEALTGKDHLRKIIVDGTGIPRCQKMREWPDVLSQFVKFQKKPNLKQFLRVGYYLIKQGMIILKRKPSL